MGSMVLWQVVHGPLASGPRSPGKWSMVPWQVAHGPMASGPCFAYNQEKAFSDYKS